MKIKNRLLYHEFLIREHSVTRAPYHVEMDFYTSIQKGDVDKVRSICNTPFEQKEGLGKLSNHPLQNYKYHMVISVAIITRFCIEGGMDYHLAYSLSDHFILMIDNCPSIHDLFLLRQEIFLDYANRMLAIHTSHSYTKPIATCIDYIYDHLHTRITLEDLTQHTHVSSSHLSRSFKKEVGITISAYILDKKLKVSERMLKYSDYSISEISEILAFSSPSYFTEVFTKHNQISPSEYRRTQYRHSGMS